MVRVADWAWLVASGALSLASAIIGLIRYRMRLKFLRHVFDAREPKDLEAAGRALAPFWSPKRRSQPPALPPRRSAVAGGP